MVKKYVLRISWNPESSEMLELSEEFSDIEVYSFDVYGQRIEVPDDMLKYLKEADATLGIC